MENNKGMIPQTIVDHLNNVNNEITLLNAEMEMMERDGKEATDLYETLSKFELKLCEARHELRKAITYGANNGW